MVPRRRGRTEQLPGVGDRWHCRRHAAAVPSDSLWSVCHRCRGARAISIIIYFFPCFYPRPILFARVARPVHVRRPFGVVRRSSLHCRRHLPVAYKIVFRFSRSVVFFLFFQFLGLVLRFIWLPNVSPVVISVAERQKNSLRTFGGEYDMQINILSLR